MRFQLEVRGRTREVIVARTGQGFAVTVDRRRFDVDAARIDAYTLSLLVDNACSHEVVVVRDRTNPASPQLTVRVGTTAVAVGLNGRRRAVVAGGAAGSGPQRIIAPMPGKVVRVPVTAGESVRAGQALVVVEAMKMENELRAARDGTVAEIHVKEGVSVDAGTPLIDIL
jgi:pyruvate carboxylase subunit B